MEKKDEIPDGASVTTSLGAVFDNDIETDVIFMVGNDKVEVKAHKLILLSRSPVFRAMFTGPLQEKGNIKIPDSTHKAFRTFLR